MIVRFIKDSFSDDLKKTIGTNFLVKDIVINDDPNETINIRMLIWDMGGEERFSNIRSIYFKGANAGIGVYAIDSPESLLKIPAWVSSIKKSAGTVPLILLGNKIDLGPKELRVDEQEALDLADTLECKHMYTSALTGENVEKAFMDIAKNILKNLENDENS